MNNASEWLMCMYTTKPHMIVICTSVTIPINKRVPIGSWASREVVMPNRLPCRRHRLEIADNWLPQLGMYALQSVVTISSNSFLLVTLFQILRRLTWNASLNTRKHSGEHQLRLVALWIDGDKDTRLGRFEHLLQYVSLGKIHNILREYDLKTVDLLLCSTSFWGAQVCPVEKKQA